METKLFYTKQEIELWASAGLIPENLLDSNLKLELENFLEKHKELLLSYSKKNPEEIYRPSSVDSQQELQIIDKKTGRVLKTFEKTTRFELCEGISLFIKDQEIEDWRKATSEVKNLSKEQSETLKLSIKKIGERPLTKEEISTLIEEIRKPEKKTRKYRQSGHLVDQKLKYSCVEKHPTFFDLLLPETKQKIEESRLEVKAEGIKLTYAENKLIHALNFLLYDKSQSNNPSDENFYSGNVPSEIVPYGLPDNKAKSPVIKFRPAELYKAFIGNEDYSGADVKFILNTLHQLESKKVLIKYDRVKKVKDGNKIKTLTDRIEDFQSLIKVISFIPDLTEEEKADLDNGKTTVRDLRGEIIIALNPIFRDQIDTKFIEFPENINRRLVIAAGGHNRVTNSMHILMEWMLREMSARRYKAEINEETLPYVLGLEKYVKEKRKKLLHERIEKDIQALVNMGIIIDIEKKQNSVGRTKLIFILNPEYE